MIALAFDTAGPVCSVALDTGKQISERGAKEPRAHARHVLATADAVLADAGVTLDLVTTLAFGEGPGGLTGVRVAASVVQAFALATGARVAAVSNLDALALRVAQGVAPGVHILVAHEAGSGTVCAQSYRALPGRLIEVAGDRCVAEPDALALPPAPLCVAGGGSARLELPDGAAWYRGEPTFASAADHLRALGAGLARVVEPEHAQPVYVRHPVDATITL